MIYKSLVNWVEEVTPRMSKLWQTVWIYSSSKLRFFLAMWIMAMSLMLRFGSWSCFYSMSPWAPPSPSSSSSDMPPIPSNSCSPWRIPGDWLDEAFFWLVSTPPSANTISLWVASSVAVSPSFSSSSSPSPSELGILLISSSSSSLFLDITVCCDLASSRDALVRASLYKVLEVKDKACSMRPKPWGFNLLFVLSSFILSIEIYNYYKTEEMKISLI